MRQLLSFLLFVSAAAAQSGGWQDLFPDAQFSQWTRIAIPPTGKLDPVTQWKIDAANKVLVCEGDRGHEMLRYNRELADFVLQVEWRFTRKEGEPRYKQRHLLPQRRAGRHLAPGADRPLRRLHLRQHPPSRARRSASTCATR